MLSLNHNLIKKRIWPIRIKDFVAIHDGDEVLGVGEVDDVVGIAREHDDALNLVSIYFIFKNLCIRVILVTKLNKSVTADYYELLPLGVMPMLSFCDSWFGDVYADLTAIQGMNEFCETASVVDVHLEVEDGFLLWEIREISTVESLCKTVCWNIRNHKGLGHITELVEEFNDLSKLDVMSDRRSTIAAFWCKNCLNTVKLTMVLLTFEGADHLIDKVVDVEELHINGRVVDGDGEVVGDVVTESSNSAVVVRSAPLSIEIRESIDKYFGSCFLAVLEHQFLASLLTFAIFAGAKATCKGRLDRA